MDMGAGSCGETNFSSFAYRQLAHGQTTKPYINIFSTLSTPFPCHITALAALGTTKTN